MWNLINPIINLLVRQNATVAVQVTTTSAVAQTTPIWGFYFAQTGLFCTNTQVFFVPTSLRPTLRDMATTEHLRAEIDPSTGIVQSVQSWRSVTGTDELARRRAWLTRMVAESDPKNLPSSDVARHWLSGVR